MKNPINATISLSAVPSKTGWHLHKQHDIIWKIYTEHKNHKYTQISLRAQDDHRSHCNWHFTFALSPLTMFTMFTLILILIHSFHAFHVHLQKAHQAHARQPRTKIINTNNCHYRRSHCKDRNNRNKYFIFVFSSSTRSKCKYSFFFLIFCLKNLINNIYTKKISNSFSVY